MATNQSTTAPQSRNQSNQPAVTHDDSIMSPTGDEMHDEELMHDSQAHYGYYRPEIRNLNDPLTYKEAVRKYRQQADPHMTDQMRVMRKIGVQNSILAKPAGH